MSIQYSAPWHRRSYETFVRESLPKLLKERLPLADYSLIDFAQTRCAVRITLTSGRNEITLEQILPAPNDEGIFDLNGSRGVIIPLASTEALEIAEIKCVGELLLDYISQRLGAAPKNLQWDQPIFRAWLPLETWV